MSKKLQKPVIIAVLALIVICGFALSVRHILSLIRNKRNADSIQSFAQQLGYTPDTYLTQYETCWEIFSTECGLVRLYTTQLDRGQLQAKIDGPSPTKVLPQDSHGYALFDTNRVTKHVLTLNGMDDSGDRSLIPEPAASTWRINQEGMDWVVTLYEIADDGHSYEFDSRPITDNIIVLMLRTK